MDHHRLRLAAVRNHKIFAQQLPGHDERMPGEKLRRQHDRVVSRALYIEQIRASLPAHFTPTGWAIAVDV